MREVMLLPNLPTLLALSHFILTPVLASPLATSAAAPSLTVSTAVASPSAAPTAVLPPQVALPPTQDWCPSEIFCAGQLLQTVNVANLYTDPKTFVDKPTNRPSEQVLADFAALGSNVSEGNITSFVDTDFGGEGLELEALQLPNFNPQPSFLNGVQSPLLRAFTQIVHGYWTQLIRVTNDSALCNGSSCESSLIPLNQTFVVPGGRFREQYYWDSFWIVEGLIQSELFNVANATLQNFMDEIERFGFIPNGGRIYYLNRSQPPLFIHMLSNYVAASGDTAILQRALPLAEVELTWWQTQRTINVSSSYTNKTYQMAHYAVTNSAPRPESYLVDYLTANDPNLTTPLNESQRSSLYAELASGAETGWDYSSRWLAQPSASGNAGLRSLNVRNTVPVCLNSILYKAHTIMASLYGSSDSQLAEGHNATAASLRAGILDLFWDQTKLAFYDYNLTSQARNTLFSAANFYPLWNGIIPDDLLSSSNNAFGFFSSLNMVMNRYNGTFPTTFLTTGLQWDAPNAWPPHQYIALQALSALPQNVTSSGITHPPSGENTFSIIPTGQLGVTEDQLPAQPLSASRNASRSGPSADINRLNGTVANGGNATSGEGWAEALGRELANRYLASALCSWHATGGSIPSLLPRLSDAELNVTQSINNTGNMFEKFSNTDIDSAGRGGEYTVQAGFGWTNGVVVWIAKYYGDLLVDPQCPPLLPASATPPGQKNAGMSMQPKMIVAAVAMGSSLTLLAL